MKKSVLKITALFMSLLMLVGMIVLPVSAETDVAAIDTEKLLASYGIKYVTSNGTKDDETVTTAVSSAALVDGSALNNQLSNFLAIKWGEAASYPVIALSDDSTVGMTDYTVTVDMITIEEQSNQLAYLFYAYTKDTTTKAGIKFRTGTRGESDSSKSATKDLHGVVAFEGTQVAFQNLSDDYFKSTTTSKDYLTFGTNPLTDSTTATLGYHRFEITVSSPAEDATTSTVTLSVDGVTVDSKYVTCSKELTSFIAFCGYKTSTVGLDNIKVTNNKTNATIYEEDFENEETAVVCDDISAYRSESGYVAPEIASVMTRGGANTYVSNQIFAGWYTDAACTKPLATNVTTGAAYAKFVPADVLTVQGQITDGTTSANATTDLRLVSTVDCLDYQYAGFRLVYNEATGYSDNITTVYKTITGADNTYVPTVFSSASEYFVLYNITSVPTTATITVNAYWVTADGTTVNGEAVTISIAEAITAIAQL